MPWNLKPLLESSQRLGCAKIFDIYIFNNLTNNTYELPHKVRAAKVLGQTLSLRVPTAVRGCLLSLVLPVTSRCSYELCPPRRGKLDSTNIISWLLSICPGDGGVQEAQLLLSQFTISWKTGVVERQELYSTKHWITCLLVIFIVLHNITLLAKS